MLQQAAASPRQLLRFVRNSIRATNAAPEAVVRSLRALAPQIWMRWDDCQRARFLRHVSVYWNVHRHLQPPLIAARLGAMRAEGRLLVTAAQLVMLQRSRDGIEAVLRDRGTAQPHTCEFDWVVNCTGPDLDPQSAENPLLGQLMRDGFCVRDPLGLGLRTGSEGALIDSEGHTAERLYYLGPMLRAKYWEATAVPELRRHARRLSRAICTALDAPPRPEGRHETRRERPRKPVITHLMPATELSPPLD